MGDTFFHILRLLCRGHRAAMRPGLVGWQFDDPEDLIRQVQLLLNHMNAMYDWLDLPEEMNERVSQEVFQLFENALQ